ncbi:hypothetical protein D3C71_1339190 [compost metagenome]
MLSYKQTQKDVDGMQRSLELDDLQHLNPWPLVQQQVQFLKSDADQVGVELSNHDQRMQIFHHKMPHLLQCVPYAQLHRHMQFSSLH